MNFLAATFLGALAVAAGPVIIHLLNRRRFMTLEWAAMDFLRQAIRKNRKILQIKDLLLLILRTLVVLLFVLAMARPYWAAGQSSSGDHPVHAVIVVDNSLSMGYSQLDKTCLDLAKAKVKSLINDQMPSGSQISILPSCSSSDWQVKGAYMTKEDACEALDQIELADRAASAAEAAELARRAIREASDLPNKRVVFVTDMQRLTWSQASFAESFKDMPQVQLAVVSSPGLSNTWISDLRLRDGIVDGRSQAVILATVRHEGPEPRKNLRASLKVNNVVVEERFLDVQPGQFMQLKFRHRFDVAGTSRKPLYVPVTLELAPDHLPFDDYRSTIAPVASGVPVVFIDQLGQDEDPQASRYGETYPLRRLLAPGPAKKDEASGQLITVVHCKMGEMAMDQLREARLVVVAGVKEPSAQAVKLLREYVEQGGLVFIAAGGDFDPGAWTGAAWLDGAGILPAPLKPQFIGQLPGANDQGEPAVFHLALNSLKDPVFNMDMPKELLEEMLGRAFFFKAAAIDPEPLTELSRLEKARVEERRKWLTQYEDNERLWAEMESRNKLTPDEAAKRQQERNDRRSKIPNWLTWQNPMARDPSSYTVEQLVGMAQPQIMGKYENGEAFAVRRKIGGGQVIFMTSGCYPLWNNMAVEHCVLVLDNMLRSLLTASLPDRNVDNVNEITIPIDQADQGAAFQLLRPGQKDPSPLRVEALGSQTYGLRIRSIMQRGIYKIVRQNQKQDPNLADSADQVKQGREDWQMLMAINGPGQEGDLTQLTRDELARKMPQDSYNWVGADESISLRGASFVGFNFWKYLIAVCLLLLLLEMFFLSGNKLLLFRRDK
ncbi:MAG: BatA domain-containing protein [Planctomycetes bacterium]|nr:BatA domain-containing protein [Planctomycetota bacterium]